LVLVIVGEIYGGFQNVGVTDGRTITVTVGVAVSVAVRMMRIVTVGMAVPVGSNADSGSSTKAPGTGVDVLTPGKKGVFDGGINAFRSSAELCFHAPGIDPVMREQPNTSIAAAGQNIFDITLACSMTNPRGNTLSISSMTILIPKTMTKITSFLVG
jgi:hypothetical protein